MTSSTFNAITYSNKLVNAGLDRKIANAAAEGLADVVNLVVTKEELQIELKQLEYRLIIRLGSMMFVCAGLVVSLIKLL